MRVAMRRLRSALGLFGRAFPHAEFEALRAESKRIAAVLGEARDWDVFVERLRDGALARFAGEPGFDRLMRRRGAKAAAGHAAVARLAARQAGHALRAASRTSRGRARLAGRGRRRGDRRARQARAKASPRTWLDALDRKVGSAGAVSGR